MSTIVNARIAADTMTVVRSRFSDIRLMNDSRWPWLLLLPVNSSVSEIHQLESNEREGFFRDINTASECIQVVTSCTSVNIAMLGNVVPDLHCHVVARHEKDPNWPGPVWGFEASIAYTDQTLPADLLHAIRGRFSD